MLTADMLADLRGPLLICYWDQSLKTGLNDASSEQCGDVETILVEYESQMLEEVGMLEWIIQNQRTHPLTISPEERRKQYFH